MTAHDEILSALLGVLTPRGGEIRLLGRLDDPLIGSNTDDAFVFVPDLHFLSPGRQASFGSYGFNYRDTELLYLLLESLTRLRDLWDDEGSRDLVTVQLGDFLDLWREVGPTDPMWRIPDDAQGRLRDVLYRGVHRGEPCLEATILLGNHDTQDGVPLPEIPFQLKGFNRSNDQRPFLFFTHGDAFDLLEVLTPEPIKAFFVHLIGRLTPTNTYSVADWGKAAARINKPLSAMKDAVTTPDHDLDLNEGAIKVVPETALPPRAVTRVDTTERDRRFRDYYRAVTLPAAADTSAGSVRVIVAGHTHHAGMLLCQPDQGRPLLLMDAGAWIEKCSYTLPDGTRVTEPSAQLAVIHGNDARIYQIRFP